MSLTEILGAEDNPFSLFLILILLLGATGYFDPAPKGAEIEAADESPKPPASTLPVWQRRPSERVIVRPFSGKPPKREEPRRDMISALSEMLGLPKPKKTFDLLRRVLAGRQSRHPLRVARHKMLQ